MTHYGESDYSKKAKTSHLNRSDDYEKIDASKEDRDKIKFDASKEDRDKTINLLNSILDKVNALDKKLSTIELGYQTSLKDLEEKISKMNTKFDKHIENHEKKLEHIESTRKSLDKIEKYILEDKEKKKDKKEKKEKESQKPPVTICVYRTETAKTSFDTFEKDLGTLLSTELKDVKTEVRNIPGITECKKLAPKILLLCAFASASRVEAETVLPMHTLFQKELPECKVICVVFRYGENAPSAKILSSKSNKEEEAIPSTSCNFISSGLVCDDNNLGMLQALITVIDNIS